MRSARLVLGAALAACVLPFATPPAAAAPLVAGSATVPIVAGSATVPIVAGSATVLPPGRAQLAVPAAVSVGIKGQVQRTSYYCAPASSAIVLRAFGVKRGQDQLAKEMRTSAEARSTKREYVLAVLNTYVRPEGYQFRLTYAKDDPAALMAQVSQAVGVLGKPTIVAVLGNRLPWSRKKRDFGHAIVAYGYDTAKGTITVWDPNPRRGATGTHVIPAKDLAAVVFDNPARGIGGVFELSKPLLPR
ncbi:C39 family peptidase [Nonomuraea sp. NPDC052116]|uniref:C39 family peptidase n=1 Tax=Nonomuraea sp. NPDC052116 TaxID=3155665 RepID=UPI003414B19B